MEQVLEQPQLVVTPDERRLERLRPVSPADLGDHPEGSPGRDRRGLAFERLLAGRLEGDRSRRTALGRLADEDRPRGGDGLQATGRVDDVTGDHPLVRGPDRHRGLPGEHPGTGGDAGAERLDGGDQLECRSDGALGVVLVRDGGAPDRHDRVADELLDRAP